MKHPNCSHGNKCTFAHSPEKLWFKETVDEKYYKHFSVIVESGALASLLKAESLPKKICVPSIFKLLSPAAGM